MRKFLCFPLLLSLFLMTACNSGTDTETTTETDSTAVSSTTESSPAPTSSSEDAGDYLELSTDMALGDYLGQQIWLEGTVADPSTVNEHMMKSSPPFGEQEKHIFINYNNGEQTTGYYTTATVPQDNAPHKFYGSIDKISGPGKGGGNHTEFFINIEKVD